jgi:hypothetical protein
LKLIIIYFAVILFCCALHLVGGFGIIFIALIFPPLAYLIVYAWSILFYSLLALPTVVAVTGIERNISLCISGITAAVVVAVFPGWVGNRQYEVMKLALQASDFLQPKQVTPRSFKIVGYGNGHDRASCQELCQELLFKFNADIV